MRSLIVVVSLFTALAAYLPLPAFADLSEETAAAVSSGAGVVLGIPVAITRKTVNELQDIFFLYHDDSNSDKLFGAAATCPTATVLGAIKGTVYGTENAFYYSITRPYCKNAFSLSQLQKKKLNTPLARIDVNGQEVKLETVPWGTPLEGKDSSKTSVIPSSSRVQPSSLICKFVAVAVAPLIGTPVCVIRRCEHEEKWSIKQICGDSENKFARGAAGVLWLPFSLTDGILESPFDATINGLMYVNRPFSKDQVSAGRLVQNE